MVPLSSVAHFGQSNTPLAVNHQGLFVATTLSFNLAPGSSLSDAVDAIEDAKNKIGLPNTVHGSFQGTARVFQDSLSNQPLLIALIALPIVLQSYGIFALAYVWAWAWKLPHSIAAPCALIGTSNFFELAVAVAIGLFGLNSGAALATVVGVLVEVPVMLSLVGIANRSRKKFPA